MDEALIKRILPHSVDAERAVIGSMLMDADAITTASEMLTGDDFYQRQYGILFETITELNNGGTPVDLITLQEALKTKDVPEELSGVEFLGDLLEAVPTSANVRHYAQMVADKAVLRRMIKANEEKSAFLICFRERAVMILCRSRRLCSVLSIRLSRLPAIREL